MWEVGSRAGERYQENTVRLLNRNNKQTIGVVNKQKTNSWVLNKQLAWSSHRGLQKPFLMSVWTKFGYLSAPVMTIIHKKTKKLPQKVRKKPKSQKTTFYVFETAPTMLDYISVAPPLRGAGKFLPQTPSFYQKWAKKHCSNRKQTLMFVNNEQRSEMGKTES